MKTDRQKDALRLIYEYFRETGKYPSNRQIANWLSISMNQWGNTRRVMIANKKLIESKSGDFKLHADVLDDLLQEEQQFDKLKSNEEQGKPQIKLPLPDSKEKKPSQQINVRSDLRSSVREITPAIIELMGEVQAGTTLGPDDLRVAFSTNTEPLSLPDIEQGQDVFALEVTGESMVSDNILPQDLIVVEKVGIDQIKIGDLIVTRYLKVKFNKLSKAEIDDILSNADNYDGPTLKYLIKKEDGVGYVLAPKNRDLRYTIETRQIKVDEIGRVVAVHRTIRRL
jgi:SOS-response transcriptional repressor LexA